jgi:hypothetical protein
MLKYLVTLVLLIVSTTVLAQAPPKRYNYPYKGKLYVDYLSTKELLKVCYGTTACAYSTDDGSYCIVYLPDPALGELSRSEIVKRWIHERAHCNGWPWYHPK